MQLAARSVRPVRLVPLPRLGNRWPPSRQRRIPRRHRPAAVAETGRRRPRRCRAGRATAAAERPAGRPATRRRSRSGDRSCAAGSRPRRRPCRRRSRPRARVMRRPRPVGRPVTPPRRPAGRRAPPEHQQKVTQPRANRRRAEERRHRAGWNSPPQGRRAARQLGGAHRDRGVRLVEHLAHGDEAVDLPLEADIGRAVARRDERIGVGQAFVAQGSKPAVSTSAGGRLRQGRRAAAARRASRGSTPGRRCSCRGK